MRGAPGSGSGRPDDDFLPADSIGVVAVAVPHLAPAAKPRAAKDRFEPRRPQSAGTRRMRKRPLEWSEPYCASVHRQLGAARESARKAGSVDPAGLEGRDLGEIEDVVNVEARPGDLDAAEAVDREV